MTDWKSRSRARRKFFQGFAPDPQHEDDKTAKQETRKMASRKKFQALSFLLPDKNDEAENPKKGKLKKSSSQSRCADDEF